METVLAPGDRCGDNVVVRLLGAGGFAQVYEVRDRTGALRALKILDAEADARPKLRARLAQEGAALVLLAHVNVVRLFDAGVDGERVYLLLERVEGKTLREVQHAHGGQLPAATAARWIRQAAEGVGEAHRRGIVHRDLKPENLLVTPQEIVKVIDFGFAKLSGWGVRTTQEQRLGTALYMSPEQIRGEPPDPRMDVYALGLILYEALAGVHPIVSEPANLYQICALQIGHSPKPLLEVAPRIPPELAAIADRAIQKDPALRFPDGSALAEALHGVLLRLGEPLRAELLGLAAAPGGDRPSPAVTQQPRVTEPARTQPLPDPAHERGPLGVRQPSSMATVAVVVAGGVLGLAAGALLGLWAIL